VLLSNLLPKSKNCSVFIDNPDRPELKGARLAIEDWRTKELQRDPHAIVLPQWYVIGTSR
jgi:hypothetical protein